MLLRGLPPKLRDRVWPAFFWYGDGLRMTNTWGMFSRPPLNTQVNVIGVTRSGERITLSGVQQSTKGLRQRVVDLRLRKIQSRLQEPEVRDHWGEDYLRYFCRAEGSRALVRVLLVLDEPGKSLETPLEVTCSGQEPSR